MEALMYIFGGGVGVAIVEGIKALILWVLNRRASKKDKTVRSTEDRLSGMECRFDVMGGRVDKLSNGLRIMLYDRIKYLGRSYLRAEEISLENREDLIDMHRVYHNDLGGNGNLDALMESIMTLQLAEGR